MSKIVIDVSEFQGNIDWNKISTQVSAAIIRLGYRGYGSGSLVTDSRFSQNMDGAISAGLPVGVYWCSQAVSDAEALEEAKYCIEKLKEYKLTYPVLLDSEHMEPNAMGRADKIGKKRRTQYGLTWARAIQDAGYIAGLYCSESWYYDEIDGAKFDSSGFDIWIAKYSSVAPKYRCDAWQFTDSARMYGISTCVDQNHVYKNYGDYNSIAETIYNGFLDIGLDATYWTMVLAGEKVASGENIKALMDKYHVATLDTEATIANAVDEIQMDSPKYWIDVINGDVEASAQNVKSLMDKYHKTLEDLR